MARYLWNLAATAAATSLVTLALLYLLMDWVMRRVLESLGDLLYLGR